MEKRRLSFWQIWNMSFGFMGIQMGFALQNSNMSRIFQTLGANIDDIPILWVAAPMTGLIVQPIIGYFSDRTWNRLGRRKPYFLAGAILASASLIIIPNSPMLWFAAGLLWIMDSSFNVSMEPFRAFVADNLSEKQRTMGFAMQSFFIGIGSYIASKLPLMLTYFGVQNTAPLGIIPDSVKYSFYIGGVALFVTIFWTIFTSKEYSPEELASFESSEKDVYIEKQQTNEWHITKGNSQLKKAILFFIIAAILTLVIYHFDLKKDLYVLSLGLIGLGGLALLVSGLMQKNLHTQNGFVNIMNDFENMPKIMKQLAIVQFFSWFSLFAMWIYTTLAVTKHIYGTTDTTSTAYNTGANQVGEMFANYNLIAAIAAFLLPVLAKKTSRKFTHFLALTLGGLGLISIYFIKTPTVFNLEWLPMIGVGIAWGSILSMPYAILSGALPAAKMGYYMGVFNFFIVIPQLVAASILGFLVATFFGNNPIAALIIGGCSMVLSGILALFFINDKNA